MTWALQDAKSRFSAVADDAWHGAQIVATALVHDLVIVTRNVSDLDFAGAKVANPWN